MLISGEHQVPGTLQPKRIPFPSTPIIDVAKQFVFVAAPPGHAVWSYAVAVSRAIWAMQNFTYWTEHDYLEDLITLQKLSDRARADDGIWHDYVEWERDFLALKNYPRLILDRAFVSHSNFQRYEIYDLLSYRVDQQLSTIVAATTIDYNSSVAQFHGLMDRRFMLIEITDEGTWPNGKR